MAFGHVEFASFSSPMGERDDPSSFVRPIDGRVFADRDLGEDDDRIEVGYINASLIQISLAFDLSYAIEDVFDANDEVARLFPAVWDLDENDFSDAISSQGWGDVLYVRELGIYGGFRGRGYGLAALRTLEQEFGGVACPVSVLEPVPLQFCSNTVTDAPRMGLDHLPSDEELATTALKNFYQQLGYSQIEGFSYMVKSML